MGNFYGYFIKAVKTGVVFPAKYLKDTGVKITPDQREEIKAYRDDYSRDLYRVTATGMKTKIVISIAEGLNKSEKEEVLKFFTDAEALETDATTAHRQRKVQLEIWDDETATYKTGYFYRPNFTWPIRSIIPTGTYSSGKEIYDMIYDKLDISLIEY